MLSTILYLQPTRSFLNKIIYQSNTGSDSLTGQNHHFSSQIHKSRIVEPNQSIHVPKRNNYFTPKFVGVYAMFFSLCTF